MIGCGADTLGIYISVPFCRSKCTYCNFASGVFAGVDRSQYIDRVIEDLSGAGAWAQRLGAELPRRVDSVYLGGGTPTLLAPELLGRLFAAVRSEFEVAPDAEITVECAPGQFGDETLEALCAAGVNRVSLGVQSFVDREAALSGRLHRREGVWNDLRRLREAGISNFSVDLIAGLPGQTADSWEESLAALADCGAPHASVYMLEVDDDSRLGRELLQGGARYHAAEVPDEEAIAAMYLRAIERLAGAGLAQYEISNFARPGFESRHNSRYWRRRPYLGVGVDAASTLRGPADAAGIGVPPVLRTTTTAELAAYLDRAAPAELEWLDARAQQEEAWFLGLRRNAGVDFGELEAEFGSDLVRPAREIVNRLCENELLETDGRTARLTARGRLLSNEVFQEFLDLAPISG